GKEVTKSLQGDDGGACKMLGWLLGGVIDVLEIDSSGWSFVSAVIGQMTYLVASLTLDSANNCVMQGASCTQRKVSMILFSTPFVLSWGGSISSDSLLPSILLLVVIIVTVMIVVVSLTVVIVVIVGVVIVIIGGVSSILKLSFVIIGFLYRIVFYYLLHQSMGYGNSFLQSLRFEAVTFSSILLGNPPMKTSMSFSEFGTMFGHKTANSWNLLMLGVYIPPRQGIISQGVSLGPVFLLGLSVFAMVAACASQAVAIPSAISCRMAFDDKLGYPLMIISRDEHLTHSVPHDLVYFPVVVESNSDNTGGITFGEVIGACSGGIGRARSVAKQGVWCLWWFQLQGGKEVTRSLQGDDRGACNVLGWLLGGVMEVLEDKVQAISSESTAHVQPLVVQVLIPEPNVALKPNLKSSIPYPSRLNAQNLREKTNIQMLNLPKKLPEKLRDLGRCLIPCDYQGLESCMALADLGASINLMPLSIWKKLSLSDLTSTRMTLELATWSYAYPAGIAEDVFVQMVKFTFLAEFVVVDYDVDPRVPLILGRFFLRTARALVDVHGEELILRDDDEQLIFHADSTLKHSHKHGNESINMTNFIDITCEDCFPEVLKFKKSNHPSNGSTTPLSDSSPSFTPFETSDFLLEEFTDELALLDPFLQGKKVNKFDFSADLKEIEYLLNQDPSTESNIETIDPILEKFTDKPGLAYLPPPGDDDDDDDDLFDLTSDNDEWKKLLYGDCHKDINSEKDKNKDSKMKLIIVEDHFVEANALLPQLHNNDSTLPEESFESSEIASLFSSPFGNKDI
nr:reverse transcriptase domain-containing protein [Tanacetum cinerariifolium]